MEDTKFIDETDYKKLFLFESKQNDELKAKLEEAHAQIDKLTDMIKKMENETADMEDRLNSTLGRAARLDGMVDAFKYCVRYYMAGDGS